MPQRTDLGNNSGTRVFLVDDNLEFLKAAVDLVRRRPELMLVGATDGSEQALSQAPVLKPQVILIDLEIPGLADLKTIPRLRKMLPGVGIVGLTMLDGSAYLKAAQEVGAHTIVSKANLVSDLLPAIHRVTEAGTTVGGAGRTTQETARLQSLP